MTAEQIERYQSLGFKRWTKAGFDRLYVNASQLGLECDYYNTGNIRNATFKGKSISNCEARRMKEAKSYIDIKTGKAHSDNNSLLMAIERIMEVENND